jgi:hypothetical protein
LAGSWQAFLAVFLGKLFPPLANAILMAVSTGFASPAQTGRDGAARKIVAAIIFFGGYSMLK